MGRQMNFVRFLKSNAILSLDWSRHEIRQKVYTTKIFSSSKFKLILNEEQILALLWNNTLIARRWNACQKNCAIIGKAIKSFRWIGRGGGWCNYEKGAAESILDGDSPIWRVIQRWRLNEVVCVTRPEHSGQGGVRSHENCWVGAGCRCRCRAGYYRGRCPLCFPRLLGWRRSAKPNPGQSSSAATLGFPRAVSSASPLSEASAD